MEVEFTVAIAEEGRTRIFIAWWVLVACLLGFIGAAAGGRRRTQSGSSLQRPFPSSEMINPEGFFFPAEGEPKVGLTSEVARVVIETQDFPFLMLDTEFLQGLSVLKWTL